MKRECHVQYHIAGAPGDKTYHLVALREDNDSKAAFEVILSLFVMVGILPEMAEMGSNHQAGRLTQPSGPSP